MMGERLNVEGQGGRILPPSFFATALRLTAGVDFISFLSSLHPPLSCMAVHPYRSHELGLPNLGWAGDLGNGVCRGRGLQREGPQQGIMP